MLLSQSRELIQELCPLLARSLRLSYLGNVSVHLFQAGVPLMPYSFEIGKRYARKNVLEVIGLQDPMGGNWYTGYASHGNDFFIFCNVGTTGRTGHDYQNEWQGADLVWYAKTGTHVAQGTMQRMLDGRRDIYVFWRTDNSAPFTFAGLARPTRVTTTTPVKVVWNFNVVAQGE